MSKLSFIVPVYRPDLILLEKVVKALVDQSLTQWEAIFVLDGPCDGAPSLIRRVMSKKPNHFQIVEIEHGGAQKARNEGAKYAKSPYWVFWDSDCVIEPHAAQGWVDILDKRPEVDFCYSGYKFLNEMGGITSEPFDPWLLRVGNYISTCFPFRKEFFPGWNESLESLQDWDFWLSIVEKGAKGHYQQGYAFSTAYPTPESISGKGCTPEAWLGRVDKVKALHNIPIRKVCVTSAANKHDGIRLAKLIDADYHDHPNDKPNHYETMIQVGFEFSRENVARCSRAFIEGKNYLFWTGENVATVYNQLSQSAIDQYAPKINKRCVQFVEDLTAKNIMDRAGFKVEVLPLPLVNEDALVPLPEKPRFLLDLQSSYGSIFQMVIESLPDVDFKIMGGVQKIEDFTGIISFNSERTLNGAVKRMLLTGRHVLSNIQSPFTGYIDDTQDPEAFINEVVDSVRKIAKLPVHEQANSYYSKTLQPARLLEVLNA